LRVGEKVGASRFIFYPVSGGVKLTTRSRNMTVAEVARKVMGDAPIAYIEGSGGVRVAEDDVVAVGKNDVCATLSHLVGEKKKFR
jgi:hypothetical protein